MNRTKIEWVRNPDGSQGYTSNPFTGCLNGCPYCYARRESYGRCKQADLLGYPLENGHGDNPFYPRYHPERLLDIVARKKPAGIFLNDRSDGFADYWPRNYQEDIWETIELCPQHRFYLLTKQYQNLPLWSPFPENCWVGVTACNADMAWRARGYIERTEAKIKYISFEPLLDSIKEGLTWANVERITSFFDWVIIGAQTRPFKPPQVEWVREIVQACDKTGIPVFLKDNLGWPKLSADGSTPFYKRCPSGTMELRQEVPSVS